jgi:hypothetical protein
VAEALLRTQLHGWSDRAPLMVLGKSGRKGKIKKGEEAQDSRKLELVGDELLYSHHILFSILKESDRMHTDTADCRF